jgi:hypothetical protein
MTIGKATTVTGNEDVVHENIYNIDTKCSILFFFIIEVMVVYAYVSSFVCKSSTR